MDDDIEVPSLTDFLASRGKTGSLTLREHLAELREYDEQLYAVNAQTTLESLDEDELRLVPLEFDQEESPYCIAYYLPDNQLIRVLPDYAFEIETWEEVAESDEELEALDS